MGTKRERNDDGAALRAPGARAAGPTGGGESAYEYDLFVLHAPAESAFVRGYLLPKLGLSPERVLVSSDLTPGAPFVGAIERGVARSRLIVAVFSSSFVADRWAAFGELLASHAGAADARLVPLRLDDCEPPLRLDCRVALDFRDRDPARWGAEAARLRALLERPAPADEAPACPYPGLRPFSAGNAAYFYGRDRDVDDLVSRLREGEREIYVVGPSGSGKSSLVAAGVVPAVADLAAAFDAPFLVRSMRPGERPAERLAEALGGASPAAALDALLAARPSAGQLLLFVDQLEELFTVAGPDARRRFVEALRALRAEPRCALLFALRADFYGELMSSDLWADGDGRCSVVNIAPLRGEALREAIEAPARRAGVLLEPRLVDRLCLDAASEPGPLPLLQEALRLVWDKRRARLLCLSEYEALGDGKTGGLAAALARRADRALRGLSRAQREVARRVFLRLVSFGEGRPDTRRQQRWSALRRAADDPGEADAVLHRLVEARLLTAGDDAGDARVDLAHEAVIGAWPALQEWLRTRRVDEERRRHYEARARAWVERGRGASGLFDAAELAEVERWARSDAARELGHDPELPALVAASRAAWRRTRRKWQSVAAVLMLFFLAALSLAGVASEKTREANAERLEARRLLGRTYKDQGQQLIAEGRPLTALPYLVAAREAGADDVALRTLFAEASRNLWSLQLRHKDAVTAAAFSPDGARLVTASRDGTARVWGAASGEGSATFAHGRAVNAAAFSPDGARVVTASDDGTARVWDATFGTALTAPLRHDSAVLGAAFSPDGARVVTTSRDGSTRVWDAASGAPLASLLEHEGWPNGAAFTPDGARVITAGEDGLARVWDAASGALLASAGKPAPRAEAPRDGRASARYTFMSAVAVSPDGARFVTASADGTARVWDALSGRPVTAALKNYRSVSSAAFSPDGARILTTGWDHKARVWDAATGKVIAAMTGHRDAVVGAAFSPDGTRAATASADKTARVWDAATGRPLTAPLEHGRKVTGVAFSPDGAWIITASEDGTARVWAATAEREIAPPLGRGAHKVTKAAFSPDGARVVTTGLDLSARLWSATSGRELGPPLKHDASLTAAAFSPDGARVVTVGSDATARVWEAASGRALSAPMEHGHEVVDVALSPDGARLVTASKDGTARVWDVASAAPISPPLQHASQIKSARFSADGRRVITASSDATARIWDATSGQALGPALEHNHEVTCAEFSPDGSRAVTASKDGTARVWDVASGRQLTPPLPHESHVLGAAFSPDGATIVTTSRDSTARLWDALTGRALTAPLQHEQPVSAAAFSPDGGRLVTASRDWTARLWDAATGKPLGPPMHHDGPLAGVAFAPDGARVLTAVHHRSARLWDASLDGGSLEQWSALARRCSAHALEAGVLVPNGALGGPCRPTRGPPSPAEAAARAQNLVRSAAPRMRRQRAVARSLLADALALGARPGDEAGEATARLVSRSLAALGALEGDLAGARGAWGEGAPEGAAPLLREIARFARDELREPAVAHELFRAAIDAGPPSPALLLDRVASLFALRRYDEFEAAARQARGAGEGAAHRVALEALSLAAKGLAAGAGAGTDVAARLLREYAALPDGDATNLSFAAPRHALRYGPQPLARVRPALELLAELEKPPSPETRARVRALLLGARRGRAEPATTPTDAPEGEGALARNDRP